MRETPKMGSWRECQGFDLHLPPIILSAFGMKNEGWWMAATSQMPRGCPRWFTRNASKWALGQLWKYCYCSMPSERNRPNFLNWVNMSLINASEMLQKHRVPAGETRRVVFILKTPLCLLSHLMLSTAQQEKRCCHTWRSQEKTRIQVSHILVLCFCSAPSR